MNGHDRRQEAKSEFRGLNTSWTEAQPVKRGKTKQKCASQFVLCIMMIRGRDKGDTMMNGSVCSSGLVYCHFIRSSETARTPVRTLTGSKSNLTNPNGNFGVCFLSQCWSNTQEDLPSVKSLTLSFNSSGLGSDSGRGELDLTQKGDSVPRYSWFRLTVWTKMHLWPCWQSLQEPLPDVGSRNLWENACPGCSIKTALSPYLETETPAVWRTALHRLSWKDTLCWIEQLLLAEAAHDYNGITLN